MTKRSSWFLTTIYVTLLATQLVAQEPIELNGPDVDFWNHIVGPREAIHIDLERLGLPFYERFNAHIELSVIVSANGRVEEAHAISGPKELYTRAEQIELSRTFKPYKRNGSVVPVRIKDFVSVVPPELWLAEKVPFPSTVDLSTLSMSLARSGCFGSCPSYQVTVFGDGRVIFQGGTDVLAAGRHSAHVTTDVVRDLLASFRKADFLSARDSYQSSVTDNSTYNLSLTLNGRTKTVEDYVGSEMGLPDAVRDLERQIDEVTDTERWTKGNARTLLSLRAEHWDFNSSSPANMALYGGAVQSDNAPLVQAFLAAKAPVDLPGSRARPQSPVCLASARGDLALVERMLGLRKGIRPDVLGSCLAAAARSGNLALLNLWLDRGADPLAKAPVDSWGQGGSVFSQGVASGRVAVVERLLAYPVDLHEVVSGDSLLTWAMEQDGPDSDVDQIIPLLIRAGANPNQKGTLMEQTPIFRVGRHPSAIPLLVANGAAINAKDQLGETPLMTQAWIEDDVRELLRAGADPTIVAKNGDTALKTAKQFSCQPCASMIEEALRKRANSH